MPQPAAAPLPDLIRAQAPETARALSDIIARLITFLATYLTRLPHRRLIASALHNRLNRISRRFARLMALTSAGKSPPIRAQKPRARKPREPHLPRLSDVYIPRAHGWLLRDLTHHGGLITQLLETLLNEAETIALLQATPQAAKLLRPLCHILAVNAPAVIPPRAPKPRKPRTRRPPDPRRMSRKARAESLRYPNFNNKPMKLLWPKNRDR